MRLGITPGMGVGPEVTLRALAQGAQGAARVVLLGRVAPLERANTSLGLPLVRVPDLQAALQLPDDALPVIEPPDEPEPTEAAAIRLAVTAALSGQLDAVVTGPIHKAALAARGFPYRGHTDFLGALCDARPVMAFAGGELRVALVTVHVPLRAVADLLTVDKILYAARTAGAALRADLGLPDPRIAVCGLNPHAGEGGLLGTEEIEVIAPACDQLRAEGWDVVGPVSAETAFLDARSGRSDLVLAMYHDQGLASLKAVDFGRSVNWTLGLPIVRTSVDHGTADALVGTGKADPGSMVAAIKLAARIVEHRRGRM